MKPTPQTLSPMRSLLFVALLVPACNPTAAKPQGPPPTPQVEFVLPTERTLEDWNEFTGRLESVDAVEVRARVGGYLQAIHFEDGQLVKQGDLLFELDPRPLAAQLEAAQADQQRAQIGLDLAQSNLDRAMQLVEARAMAAEELEQRKADAAGAQAALLSAQARVTSAQLNLDFTKVLAPISGRISDHYVSVGNQISGGSSDSTLLTTIVTIDPIYCGIEASENMMLATLRRQAADVSADPQSPTTPAFLGLADEKGFPHAGLLDFVDNRFDADTATLRARIKIDNADGQLIPGMFARVRLSGGPDRQAILIPDKAVQTAQDSRFVLLVGDENVVQYRPVQAGRLTEDGLREITQGLSTSDRVIVAGLFFARPGATVAPRPAAPAGSPAKQ
ncbi:MAG: efflux RND transporter periplasmic adaptor subunit [Planctomycetes bacterium]|nr:efflux RND transporter periplasmic adaptor subunit [Planctomycetota bacterium]MCB9911918.1 efflux RND transporter periplasmic adaptor subunit [Planctomycetota bacterium]